MYKKLLSVGILSAFVGLSFPALAYNESFDDVEHLKSTKDAKIDLVKITQTGNIIQKENYLEVVFAQNFNSKYYKTGDFVQFVFNSDVKPMKERFSFPAIHR